MAKVKILIQSELLQLYKQMTDLKAANFLISAQDGGIDSQNLDKDFACYFKISREEKTFISYNTISEVAAKLNCKPEQILSGEVQLPRDEAFYTPIKRTKIKPGRIFSKVFSPEFLNTVLSNKDIEDFSNRYSGILSNNITLALVKGEDIRKSYLKSNYSEKFGSGTLHGSCMNGDRQQELLDIYVKNDNVSLLVAYDINGKIAGRAMVWAGASIKNHGNGNEWINDVTYMDRIYHTADWITDRFKEYAKRMGWYSRKKQGYDEALSLVTPTGLISNLTIKVPLANIAHKFYPYLDTFYIPCYKQKFITNDVALAEHGGTDSIYFRQTSGITGTRFNFIDQTYIRGDQSVWMKTRMSYFPTDASVYSSKSDDYFMKKECLYSELDKEHITPDEDIETCIITSKKYKKAKMVESAFHKGMIHKKESVETKDQGILHKDSTVYSKTFKCSLSKIGSTKIEAIDDFIPTDVLSNVDQKQFTQFLEILNKYVPKEDEKKKSSFIDELDLEQYVFEF